MLWPLRPVLEYWVTLAPTESISVKFVPSVERSIWNPCSLLAASAHVRSIWKWEIAVAARFALTLGLSYNSEADSRESRERRNDRDIPDHHEPRERP